MFEHLRSKDRQATITELQTFLSFVQPIRSGAGVCSIAIGHLKKMDQIVLYVSYNFLQKGKEIMYNNTLYRLQYEEAPKLSSRSALNREQGEALSSNKIVRAGWMQVEFFER